MSEVTTEIRGERAAGLGRAAVITTEAVRVLRGRRSASERSREITLSNKVMSRESLSKVYGKLAFIPRRIYARLSYCWQEIR
jgi:hypothetical protein